MIVTLAGCIIVRSKVSCIRMSGLGGMNHFPGTDASSSGSISVPSASNTSSFERGVGFQTASCMLAISDSKPCSAVLVHMRGVVTHNMHPGKRSDRSNNNRDQVSGPFRICRSCSCSCSEYSCCHSTMAPSTRHPLGTFEKSAVASDAAVSGGSPSNLCGFTSSVMPTHHDPAGRSMPQTQRMKSLQASTMLVSRIRRGLEVLEHDSARDQSPIGHKQVDPLGESNSRSSRKSLAQLESDIWTQSLQPDAAGRDHEHRLRSWALRILAANLHMFRTLGPGIHDVISVDVPDVSIKTQTRWLDTAKVINQVVSGLWPFWGTRAYLIHEAVASTQNETRYLVDID